MKRFIYTIILLAVAATSGTAQMSKATKSAFALTNATIYTVSEAGVLEEATLLIEDGEITAIGTNVEVPAGAETIDCEGKRIYPGFIDGGTRLGLVEVNSLEETRDYREIGEITPHVQALTAVNPNSVSIPVTRVSGVTTVIAAPTGGLFPGTSALINLHGYTPKQMYAGFKAVCMAFPSSARRGRYDRRSDEKIKKEREEAMQQLKDSWENAELYARIDSAHREDPEANEAPDYYPEMAALAEVITGERKLMIEVNSAHDILDAIDWSEENNVEPIFTGVSEGWRVAEQLAEANIPVVTGPVISIPTREADRFDKAYANAGLMDDAGVTVAIRTNEAENVRNLPYHAGFAAAYGMDPEAALAAVTRVPAEMFGVSDRLGTLEEGKEANLFVCDGDPFETRTTVNHVFISGWKIPNDSRHIRLYQEFLEREPGLTK
mgnify:CR=1 FL=1